MRPRQSSLGNDHDGDASVALDVSRFNEAEAIKPRKLWHWPRVRHLARCFNEVEAIKPRKRNMSLRNGQARTRFNEAEAIKPRKQGYYQQTTPCPPRFNEAEAIKPRKLSIAEKQRPRSPSFNEAEAIKPRKPGDEHRDVNCRGDCASMRPRQSSLGNRKAGKELAMTLDASMRPRQSSLGNWSTRAPGTGGSCFNEAEAIKPRKL